MINVDDRLIRDELRKIGVDAFSILMCITAHLGKSSTAWPGVARLREMTSLSKERTYAGIKRLIDSGMVERWQENEKGVWGKVVYRVTTQYLNIYVSASKFELTEREPLAGKPEHGYPEYGKPETGNTAHISINKEEVIVVEGIEKWSAQILSDDMFLESACITYKKTKENISAALDSFLIQKRGLGEDKWKSYSDFRKNFFFWIPKSNNDVPNRRSNVSSTPRQEKRIISEETHRRALAITLAELGVTGSAG